MILTIKHFSHPKHELILKEFDVIGDDATCCICDNTVIGLLAYTCSANDNVECKGFYLHKSCAELPSQICFHKHNQHPLDLIPRPEEYDCDACGQYVKFSYACDDCVFDVCVVCAFQQRELRHEGHPEHTLTLMPRKSLFDCDACSTKANDSSYVCTTCDFWMHKECAFSPLTIPDPTYHHHPLHLIYSIPNMHRYFDRRCNICGILVQRRYWLYYCHKCTYFVHMKCATSSHTAPIVDEIEAEGTDNEPLVELPLHSEESLFDLIIAQCCKLQLDSQGEDKNSIAMATAASDPHIITEHWSHKEHPLVRFQFTIREDDNDDNINYRRVLICDGCIQPITLSHPPYYACNQCDFFLHSFCATKFPVELPAGVSSFHPQHSLTLCQKYNVYSFVTCDVCCYKTNGFYYLCKPCNIRIEIRCAFLPTKIKHKSHKHHSLIQGPSSLVKCRASNIWNDGVPYACETCSNFQIHTDSAFYPSRMTHRYDDHPIILRHPPFFHEGVIYCEICEEQVDNQSWLYHCAECNYSFHYYCIRWPESIKLGGTITLDINNQSHTLTMVLKDRARKNSPLYYCKNCGHGYNTHFFFECDGCGHLICRGCVRKIVKRVTSQYVQF